MASQNHLEEEPATVIWFVQRGAWTAHLKIEPSKHILAAKPSHASRPCPCTLKLHFIQIWGWNHKMRCSNQSWYQRYNMIYIYIYKYIILLVAAQIPSSTILSRNWFLRWRLLKPQKQWLPDYKWSILINFKDNLGSPGSRNCHLEGVETISRYQPHNTAGNTSGWQYFRLNTVRSEAPLLSLHIRTKKS